MSRQAVFKEFRQVNRFRIQLLGGLSRHADGVESFDADAEDGKSVGAACASAGLPVSVVAGVFLDGKQVGLDYVPKPGDIIRLYPAMTGG